MVNSAHLCVQALNQMLQGVLNRILSNPYLISVHLLALIGTIIFIFLPKDLKKQPKFFWAVFILFNISFYELFGSYTLVNRDFNESMHHLISNVPYQGWNLWAYNIFRYQISLLFFISWISLFIENKKLKKILISLLLIFIGVSLFLELTKIQEITGFQPIIYFMGYVLSITACCLFFVDLVSSERYLDINPLRFIPFWFITCYLFQNVLLMLAEIAGEYLSFNNLSLYFFFKYISMILYFFMLALIVSFFLKRSLLIEKKVKTAL